ncbi:DUF3159 domain-containing protein [Actinospica durhamensis]|uniref:DUF3159 domain-containing protein n=1 Tax=Actinospica durhamensis TaxID=1508375 RepID=A0A941EQQ4_9ACTN|nr:DUF3159 domain-containing protein [Actinospica durhamensis]MBR7836222.1 DUF3159 domain-containing protein [Actinospica durhamensis]
MSAEAAAAAPQPQAAESAPPEAATPEPTHEERLAAYQASVFAAFGGRRGLAEVGLPSILFVLVYGISRNLGGAIWAAVAVAAVLSAVRLVKRDTLQHALGGLAGVLVCAAVAHFSGQAKGFYLPGVLLNIGYAIVFSVSAVVRWPIVGVVLGPVTGEMMAWRESPARARAFTLATWLLAAMFTFRVCVEVPLYLSNQIDALGVAKIIMSYPLYLAVVYACWQIIRRAPLPPIKAAHAAGEPGQDAAAAES